VTTAPADRRPASPRDIIVSHDPRRRALIERAMPAAHIYTSMPEAFLAALRAPAHAVVLDMGPLADRNRDFVVNLRRERPQTPIYLVTEPEGEPAARALVDAGASDYFILPGDLDRLATVLSPDRKPLDPSEDSVPTDPPSNRPAERQPPPSHDPPAPAPENSQPSASEEPGDRPPEAPDRLTRPTLRDPETVLLTVQPFKKCITKMIAWACDHDAEVAVVLMEAPAASPETLAQLGRAVHATLTPQHQGGRLETGRFGVAWPRLLEKNEERGETAAVYLQAAEELAALGKHLEPGLAVRIGVAVFPGDGNSADVLLKTAEERLQAHDSLAKTP